MAGVGGGRIKKSHGQKLLHASLYFEIPIF